MSRFSSRSVGLTVWTPLCTRLSWTKCMSVALDVAILISPGAVITASFCTTLCWLLKCQLNLSQTAKSRQNHPNMARDGTSSSNISLPQFGIHILHWECCLCWTSRDSTVYTASYLNPHVGQVPRSLTRRVRLATCLIVLFDPSIQDVCRLVRLVRNNKGQIDNSSNRCLSQSWWKNSYFPAPPCIVTAYPRHYLQSLSVRLPEVLVVPALLRYWRYLPLCSNVETHVWSWTVFYINKHWCWAMILRRSGYRFWRYE